MLHDEGGKDSDSAGFYRMVESMKSSSHYILADGRWRGQHGIGRFSTEVLSRLKNVDILSQGPAPLSLKNLFWQSRLLSRQQAHRVYFTPGFNPVLRSDIPFVLTIHDLIHLHFPGKMKWLKQFFYTIFIKSSAKNAAKIVTVSNYSKQCILDWTGLPDEKVVVAGNGILCRKVPATHLDLLIYCMWGIPKNTKIWAVLFRRLPKRTLIKK